MQTTRHTVETDNELILMIEVSNGSGPKLSMLGKGCGYGNSIKKLSTQGKGCG